MKSQRSLITRRPLTAYRRLSAPPAPGKAAAKLLAGALAARPAPTVLEATRDKQRLVLEADKEVVIRCGKASITLTADGKIVIKGANLLSTSSGQHRIRGASVSIN